MSNKDNNGREVTDAVALESKALRQAVLNSEQSRITGVLVAISVMVIFVFLRDLAAGYTRHMMLFIPFLAVLAAYEGFMLAVVRRAIREDRDFSAGVRLLNVFVESQAPTVAMLLMARLPSLGPQGALITPALLTYFLFITLSTLRLDPKLSALTGLFSALGYGVASAFALANPGQSIIRLPASIYITHSVVILGAGLVAAAVAKQIVGYLEGALREAELRRKVDKIENELDIARSIQQGLLPGNPPDAGGFQIAGWNEPADQTGGDYFDWQELPDGKLAVTIADVTGHGIAPALMMAVCRAYARATFPADPGMSAVMNRLNRLLVADLPAERFVTMAAVVLDPSTACTQVLSAGHGPLLLYRAESNTVQQLNPNGIPLGLISVINYGDPDHFQMMPGDIMVMLTDGFFEWENTTGHDFGVERVERFLIHNHHLPPDEIIRGLHTEVLVFSQGTPQMDDLTAVVIKRTNGQQISGKCVETAAQSTATPG